MAPFRQLVRGVRALFNRQAADRAVDDEVQHYLDEATAVHVTRGLSERDARRAARLELGSTAGVREQVRESGWEHVVETALADLTYASRRLRSSPGFTAITVLTLALGIGATTAIFSVVNPILFAPLPYPASDRIAMILEMRNDGAINDGTFGMYRGFAGRSRAFEAISVLRPWQPTITGADQPERFSGQRASATYFNVLGVLPAIGRNFDPADDRLNGPRVVVLGDALWRRRFAADPAVIGRQIRLDDIAFSVIGVMPAGFEDVLNPAAELWTTLQYDMSQGRAWGHHLRTVGRLKAGVSLDAAAREIDTIGRAVLEEQRPETYGGEFVFRVRSLHAEMTRGVRPALLAILGAVALVLVMACVNVTNLLLGRGVQRRGEFALRAALGAGRHRLIRQLLTESLLLALLGGAAGMGIAVLGVDALVALSPPDLPRVGAIGVDRTLFVFGFLLTAVIGVAFGVMPALQAARHAPQQELQRRSPRTAGHHHRMRTALVIAEVAISLVLLVSSGLLLRSLDRLFAVDAGFDPERVLTMQVQATGRRFDDPAVTARFFQQTLDAVRQVPGVSAAALTSQLPISGDRDEYGVHFEPATGGFNSFRYAVSPGYIDAMRIPLRRGRVLDERDRDGAPLVALISESLARRRFGTADPLGQRLRVGPTDGPPYTIVGVVGDVRQVSLALDTSDAVYTTLSQWPFGDRVMSVIARSNGDPSSLAPEVRRAVWSVDKDQPIVRVATLDALVAASAAERRFALVLFEAFALAALLLAAAGIYGVLAGGVAERTREIGVRAALGATRGKILLLVVRQGMMLTGVGVAIGLAAALAASEAIAAMLFGISRFDPVTYLGVMALLASVAMIACAVPAWRAMRVDPATTLRAD